MRRERHDLCHFAFVPPLPASSPTRPIPPFKPMPANSLSICEALDAFLSDPHIRGRLKPSTLRAYRTDLQAAALGLPAQLTMIGPAELRIYLDQKIAPSTAVRRLASLRRWCAPRCIITIRKKRSTTIYRSYAACARKACPEGHRYTQNADALWTKLKKG